jgi:hypothetical protein
LRESNAAEQIEMRGKLTPVKAAKNHCMITSRTDARAASALH